MNAWIYILVGVAALALGALLAALYASLRNFSRSALEEIATIRDGRVGPRIARIVADPEAHAGAILLPRVLCQLTVVVASVVWLESIAGAAEWLEIAGGILIAGVLVWVFGTVIPISIAEHAAEKTIYRWAGFVRAINVLMSPAAAATGALDELVRRVVGGKPVNAAQAVEAEILDAIEEGEREGQIDETEREMIEAVVEFRSRTVEQIMTPRTEVQALEYSDDLVAVESRVREIGHSRIPVFTGSLDTIDGMLYAKDLLHSMIAEQVRMASEPARIDAPRADGARPSAADGARADGRARGDPSRRGHGFNLRKLLRPAVFVPETKTVRELLAEMLAKRVHVALVADEYGGTSGLVTFEDIVEEVFGDIQDEYEPPPEHDEPGVEIDQDTRTAQVDARLRIDDANDRLETIGVHLPESEDYDTVGGLVVVTLGRIPTAGESVTVDGAGLTVLEAEPTRVTRVRVERKTPIESEIAPQAWDGGGK